MNNYYELTAATLLGKDAALDKNIDWADVIETANVYSMTQLIARAVNNSGRAVSAGHGELIQLASDEELSELRTEDKCRNILKHLNSVGVNYALAGEFVLKSAYASSQTRVTKELLLLTDDIERLDRALTSLGYKKASEFPDKAYYECNDSIPICVCFDGMQPEGEFADLYGLHSCLSLKNCRIKDDGGISYKTLTPTVFLEYTVKYAAQAFMCGGLSPLEVWDIIMFASSNEIDWDSFVAEIDKASLTYFTAVIFAIAAKYAPALNLNFIYSTGVGDEILDEFCIDTVLANPEWDNWSVRRKISVPKKLRSESSFKRFFQVCLGSGTMAQILCITSERKNLLKDLGLI